MAAPSIPSWLATMRSITGTKEVQGGADSPVIMKWRDEIARLYPDMAPYCATLLSGKKTVPDHDVPFCNCNSTA